MKTWLNALIWRKSWHFSKSTFTEPQLTGPYYYSRREACSDAVTYTQAVPSNLGKAHYQKHISDRRQPRALAGWRSLSLSSQVTDSSSH